MRGAVKLGIVKPNIDRNMTVQECEEIAKKKQLVPDDKFDHHYKKARIDDLESKALVFAKQTELSEKRRQERLEIPSSIY